VKPPQFAYADPATLEEVLAVLAQYPEAKVLAGGQSLMPLLNMRLARPPVLVDLRRVAELRQVREEQDGGLTIGAMVTHRELTSHPLVRSRWPLVAEAARHIGHEAIRVRGTLGGSLVHADPAAELPAVAVAAEARLVLRRHPGEKREVAAADFFVTYLTTDVAPGEVLTEVRFPPPPPGAGMAFEEVARRAGDFALAGAAAMVVLDAEGTVRQVSLALCGVGPGPVRAHGAEALLVGRTAGQEAWQKAAEAVREEVDPDEDVHATRAYRRHVAGVVAQRALSRAAQRARKG
jgi:carbon-monoxide dehydrogenase medium subunit